MSLRGIIPPLVTPFTPDGALDLGSLDRLVDRLLDAGVHGLFVMGSTGEVAYLTDEERVAVTERVAARVDGRVPVVAGCIDLTQRRVIEQAKRVADAGASHVVTTAPLYALNDRQETLDHFRAVAQGSPVPVVAYDVTVRTHAHLTVDLALEMGREGTIVAVKDSSGDDVFFRRLVQANRAAGGPLSLLSGHEVVLDGALLSGADGAVPGMANVIPELYLNLWEAASEGRWADAKTIQDRINDAFEIVFQAPGRSGDAAGVGAFKAALCRLGVIDSAAMAYPVKALDGPPVAAIDAILGSCGLLPA